MRELSLARLVISGASSGVGKTSFMLGLVRALVRRGLKVQTFKCGPDYLDPSYHRLASGRVCHNLDSWMMGSDAVRASFARSAADADIALIEGVMGLFDGASPTRDEGSTAEIAKILAAPCLVLLDAGGMARTLAALYQGLKGFDPELSLGGCIANQVGSTGHAELLAKALGPDYVGAVLRKPELAIPERHLGLVWARSDAATEAHIEAWADHIEASVDLDKVLTLARSAAPLEVPPSTSHSGEGLPSARTIAIAQDEAFSFYYEENLHQLRAAGARLEFFSPLHDVALPQGIDAVYIGGGYPELYAEVLASNQAMKASLRAFAAEGGPIYAECGGLMYLCRTLVTLDGQRWPMLDLLPAQVQMYAKLQALGYVETELTETSILGPAGLRFRGHQFRYSELEELEPIEKIYRVRRKRKGDVIAEGFRSGTVLGSYVHAHWASNNSIPRFLVTATSHHTSPTFRPLSFEGKE